MSGEEMKEQLRKLLQGYEGAMYKPDMVSEIRFQLHALCHQFVENRLIYPEFEQGLFDFLCSITSIQVGKRSILLNEPVSVEVRFNL